MTLRSELEAKFLTFFYLKGGLNDAEKGVRLY